MSFNFEWSPPKDKKKKMGGIYKKPSFKEYWDLSNADENIVIDESGQILQKTLDMKAHKRLKETQLDHPEFGQYISVMYFDDGRVCLFKQDGNRVTWLDDKQNSKDFEVVDLGNL